MYYIRLLAACSLICLQLGQLFSQNVNVESNEPILHLDFNDVDNTKQKINSNSIDAKAFVDGLDGNSLRLSSINDIIEITNKRIQINNSMDFSIVFWIKSSLSNDKQSVLLSTKRISNKSLNSQKKQGWTLGISGGTLAWNIGSGKRRLTYDRDNGKSLPLNDNKWHQLAMTYNAKKEEVRLYHDGVNKAIYKLNDTNGFEFGSKEPLAIGWKYDKNITYKEILPEIGEGRKLLQNLVNQFNNLGIGKVESNQFITLVVNPKELLDEKIEMKKSILGSDTLEFLKNVAKINIEPVLESRKLLMKNAYTVYQVRNFMKVARLFKVYKLENDKVHIDKKVAKKYTQKEKLYKPEVDIDNLTIWDCTLSSVAIQNNLKLYTKKKIPSFDKIKTSLTAAVWNIWHGGIHNTIEKDGWDSRKRIVEMLKKEKADVIMMQETYSSGDYIAAELGYYYTTTVDWDYLNQGSNISVISRYPIEEVFVPEGASFMNVAAKIKVSDSQKIYVMSNWYGMSKFSTVYNFHKERFMKSDSIPVLFGGDFNAVPHTDGGKSPASKTMLEAGFTDAYRSLYPDINKYPGYTHQGGYRIDQLYYKGEGLENTSTKVISKWPTGFPSDHYLIVAKFKLK